MTQLGNKIYGKFYISKKNTLMWLFLVVLTLPHMNPAYLERISSIESIMNMWRLMSFAVVVFWTLFIKKHISSIVIIIAAWELLLFITTLFHQGEVYNSVTAAFSVLSIVLLYDVAHDKGEIFLSSQLFCFEIVIYINLITELIYPNGLYTESSSTKAFVGRLYWFLGYYNNHTRYFVPALLFAWLYYQTTRKKGRTLFLTGAIFLSAVLAWSGGTILSLLAMIIVFIFFKNRVHIFNYYTYWMLHIIFFVFVIILKSQNLFMWLIDDFLGKRSSLIGRMLAWDRTLKIISDSPLFGYGIKDSFFRVAEYNVGWAAIHAHNMLLEILYQSGVVGICLWTLIVIIAGKRVYKCCDKEENKIIAIAFLGWCVATLVEPFTSCFLMGMFVIAYYSNSALGSAKNQTERRTLKRMRSAARELSGA